MLFLFWQWDVAGLPLCCGVGGSLWAEDIRAHGGKGADCPHFTDTDHNSCAVTRSGNGLKRDSRLSHYSSFAFLLPQLEQNFIFSLLPHQHLS